MAGAAVLAVLLALAPVAAAHSTLVSTAPARDRVLERPPDHVLMHFDEPVETALGSIAVYDGGGERVDAGKIMRPSQESVEVAIDKELERGTYTVAWRVISADSDPIKGAWVFHVEEPGSQPAGIAAEVLSDTPLTVSIFYLGGRFLDFTLLLLCVGGVAALAFALRSAAAPVRRRLLGLLAGLAAALTAVALVGLGLQGSAAGGGSLGDGFQWDSVTSVADTRFGHFSLARAGLAAALCVVALFARRRVGRGAQGLAGTDGPADDGRFGRPGAGSGPDSGEPPPERRRASSASHGNGAVTARHRVGTGARADRPLVARVGQQGPEPQGHAAARAESGGASSRCAAHPGQRPACGPHAAGGRCCCSPPAWCSRRGSRAMPA